jgi:dihydroorotate dehydrogenase (NAD+) catalytic subunit
MAIDVETRRPRLATITGGLSGPAIRPLALAKVYELCRTITIPVIAIGGIMSAGDALEFFFAGARAIQVGTANFIDPCAALKIISDLGDYCERNDISSISEIIGAIEI